MNLLLDILTNNDLHKATLASKLLAKQLVALGIKNIKSFNNQASTTYLKKKRKNK